MKLLGIDFGSKRIGLALSNEDQTYAFPHSILPNDEQMFDALLRLIKTEGVSGIVLGHSLDLAGKENPVMRAAHKLRKKLESSELPVHLEEEWYTTAAARRGQEGSALVDASAAALILQSYLDKRNVKRES